MSPCSTRIFVRSNFNMRSYEEFKQYLSKGRDKLYPGRPLRYQTRVYYEPNDRHGRDHMIVIRYYSTEILRFHDDGVIDVFTNGWNSRTTLERLNDYTPFSFFRWRWKPKEEAHLAITRKQHSWYLSCNGTTSKDVFLYIEPIHSHVRILTDKRRAPFVIGCEPTYRGEQLHTVDYWVRAWTKQEQLFRNKAKQLTKRIQLNRRRLIQVDRFWKRHGKYRDEMVLKLAPWLETMEQFLIHEREGLQQAQELMADERRQWSTERTLSNEALALLHASLADATKRLHAAESMIAERDILIDNYAHNLGFRFDRNTSDMQNRERSIMLEVP
jgi:hypothetical protein